MNMDCPKCNGRLQSTAIDVYEGNKNEDLKGADEEYELEVDQCFVCGGVWFDKGKLETYLKEQLKTVHSPSLGTEMDKRLNQKKGKCPVCQIVMSQQPYTLDHGIQVDVCTKCGGVWLDSTEIDRLEAEEFKLLPINSRLAYAVKAILGSHRSPSSIDPGDNVDLGDR